MNSMVLARKYRPRGFDSMVGQGHVVQALANALTQQRLHHAYLFTGTRGVGKTTVSRILAKSLNCVGADGQGTITASPCGQCQPCRDIDAGRFVDYIELDAASNRGVEEISQLLEQAVYKPVVGRFKVYMIDEVHMLSNTAFNAMLKTLEEPPEYLKFVLATTDPQKVPVTVLSRCLQFNLRPMAMQTVQEHLAHVLTTEGLDFDAAALRLLARAARGSMRDALSLTDQAIAFGGGRIEESPVRQMLGAVDRQHVQRIIECVASGDGAGLVAAVDTLRQLGLSASGTLEELAAGLQRMAVIQAVPGAVDEGDDPDAATWQRLAPTLPSDETQLFYSLCLQGRAELGLAPDEYSGLLMLLLRLLAFKPGHAYGAGSAPPPKAEGSVSAPALTEPPRQSPAVARPSVSPMSSQSTQGAPLPRPVTSSAPSVTAAPAPEPVPAEAVTTQAGAPWDDAPPPSEEPLVDDEPPALPEPDELPEEPAYMRQDSPEQQEAEVAHAPDTTAVRTEVPTLSYQLPDPGTDPLSDRWAQVVSELQTKGSIAALVRELAMQSQCLAQRDEGHLSVWHLTVERESLRTDANRERLTQALAQLLGREVRIDLDRGAAFNTPAQRDQVAREKRQQQAERLIATDPLVSSLLQQYPGAKIVPGTIRPVQ